MSPAKSKSKKSTKASAKRSAAKASWTDTIKAALEKKSAQQEWPGGGEAWKSKSKR